MASIFILTNDAFLHVLQYLDIQDTIAFAYTCDRFRQICYDERVFSKVDLSKCLVRRKQAASIKQFFQDKQMAQCIRELNLNNHRVMNWQIDNEVKEFIIASCPQLEVLHVLNCRMSLVNLHHILQRIPTLIDLSFSMIDLSPEDINFIQNDRESANGIYFENIKRLRFEIPCSATHVCLLSYLVLSCCKYLEELQVCIWDLPWTNGPETNDIKYFILQRANMTTEFLQHFHSLTVETVLDPEICTLDLIKKQLNYFIDCILAKKSHEVKWKKFWISQSLDTTGLLSGDFVQFDSVEAFSTNIVKYEENEVKSLFRSINDRAVRKLQLHNFQLLSEFTESVARIGGNALQCLSLSNVHEDGLLGMHPSMFFDLLFSACINITELDLIECHFDDTGNICKPLSKLKHLTKILVQKCAIDPVNEVSGEFLEFVENCQNVKEFDVHGCSNEVSDLSSYILDRNLQALAKWPKLESLTFHEVLGKCKFLWKIKENCKFLSMLRISLPVSQELSYLPILECAKILKHLAIQVPQGHLGSEYFWMFLSRATSLERLCIKSWYEGSLNICAAVEMIKSLPRLQVFHLHLCEAENLRAFAAEVIKTLEEEGSDRSSNFEFLLEADLVIPYYYRVYKNMLPKNVRELCFKTPSF